jgi:hypothetical protein
MAVWDRESESFRQHQRHKGRFRSLPVFWTLQCREAVRRRVRADKQCHSLLYSVTPSLAEQRRTAPSGEEHCFPTKREVTRAG